MALQDTDEFSHSASNGDTRDYSSISYPFEHDFECDYAGRNIFAFNLILTIFGILSAAIVVAVLIFKRQLRSSQYLLLNMLILFYLLQLILCGFVYTEEAFDPCWRAGRVFCLIIKLVEPVLTYGVVVFLTAVAVEQLYRYRVNAGDGQTSRANLIAIVLWLVVVVLSSPDMIIALSEPSQPNDRPIHVCYVGYGSVAVFYVMTSKQVLLEYFFPLLAVYIQLSIIMVVRLRSSRSDTDPVTTSPGLTQTSPKYYALLATITITYSVGYFPHYVYLLSSVIMRLSPPEGRASDIWGHLQSIRTLFALIPPAFNPVFILLLSRAHLNATVELARSITMGVRGSGWRRTGRLEDGDQEEEAMTINMNQL